MQALPSKCTRLSALRQSSGPVSGPLRLVVARYGVAVAIRSWSRRSAHPMVRQIRADCAVWVAQLGPTALRPGLSEAQADVIVTVGAPYLYSMFTVDLG